MNPDCIFCKIVAGQIPCSKVYEDDEVLAFMDIGPIVKGHTLVIPKAHWQDLFDTPPDLVGRVVAAAQMNGLKADGVNIFQANRKAADQVVPHLHFHVIPRRLADGHHWNWAAKKYEGPEEMAQYAETIRRALAP